MMIFFRVNKSDFSSPRSSLVNKGFQDSSQYSDILDFEEEFVDDKKMEVRCVEFNLAYENRQRCLVYTEDTITKTNNGGLDSMWKQCKVHWIHPAGNISHCPIRLVDKYMSLCPPVTKSTMKPNFYLRSLKRFNPAQWYSTQVVGLNTLCKTVGQMLKDANLDGYFTNHSLRRTGTTRLFHAGIDRKLVKEYSAHRSDAVDQYQITSNKQKENISKVLVGENEPKTKCGTEESAACNGNADPGKFQIQLDGNTKCSYGVNSAPRQNSEEVTSIFKGIFDAKKSGKTVVKIEIEFSDD